MGRFPESVVCISGTIQMRLFAVSFEFKSVEAVKSQIGKHKNTYNPHLKHFGMVFILRKAYASVH